jgi:hypothetical protein
MLPILRVTASLLLAGLVALATACSGGYSADSTGIYSPSLDPNRPGAFSGGGGGGGGGSGGAM